MVDRLETLLAQFTLHAELLPAGVAGAQTDNPAGEGGHLHLLREGALDLLREGAPPLRIDRPALLLVPRPLAHRLVPDADAGADLISARLRFEGGAAHPIAAALPPVTCLPLDAVQGAGGVLALLLEEAARQYCGRQAVLDRLFEVLFVQILRHQMESGTARMGLLAGLAHPRLRLALVAMHDGPARDWSLEALAGVAGMSRSVFAGTFRDTVGATPGAYLQGWRIGLAQRALRAGRPMKRIAVDVGYGSEAALSRAFKAQTGLSPRQWRGDSAA